MYVRLVFSRFRDTDGGLASFAGDQRPRVAEDRWIVHWFAVRRHEVVYAQNIENTGRQFVI